MNEDNRTMAGDHQAHVRAGKTMPGDRLGVFARQCGTGFCFVLYGAVAWSAGLIVLPVIRLWPAARATRQRRIRAVVGLSFRWLLALIAGLRLGHVEIEGREWLEHIEGKLLVANHPMYLDVVALIGLLPQADCVIKRAMWENRLYRRFVQAIGYIGNSCEVGLIDGCVASVHAGRSLLLFPEGTRSTPGTPPRFLRGAAQVAIRSGCPLVPVVIRCEPRVLGKGQAWHEVGDRPFRLRLKVCPPMTLTELGCDPDLPHGVAARHATQAMEAFFSEQLASHPRSRAVESPIPESPACMVEDP